MDVFGEASGPQTEISWLFWVRHQRLQIVNPSRMQPQVELPVQPRLERNEAVTIGPRSSSDRTCITSTKPRQPGRPHVLSFASHLRLQSSSAEVTVDPPVAWSIPHVKQAARPVPASSTSCRGRWPHTPSPRRSHRPSHTGHAGVLEALGLGWYCPPEPACTTPEKDAPGRMLSEPGFILPQTHDPSAWQRTLDLHGKPWPLANASWTL